MQTEHLENQTQANQDTESRIIKTNQNAKNGQDKCPKCGATDIDLNIESGKLRCNFCRYEFLPDAFSGLETDLNHLQGEVIASGAQDIVADSDDIITLQCSSCGAEVVIDTQSVSQARCHWCRNTLSINQQIPNGAIPDALLPFLISKEEAKVQIETFVKKRKFFAHPKFRAEFTTQNIMGVYFPYMIIDVNAHAKLSGQGEKLIRQHSSGDSASYDADLYHVEREFDLTIQGLTIESNAERFNHLSNEKTNNVINAIMPFDIENCVRYNANYLKGFTSERRNMNVEQLKSVVDLQAKDIARFSINDTLREYDRGVAWSKEQLEVKGQQWKTAYLPVWLYSYQQVKGGQKRLHYVAVNARTKETMGSVPIHMPKLLGISVFLEILGLIIMFYLADYDFDYSWAFALLGVIYFLIMFTKYRNANARHNYEVETKTEKQNIKTTDYFVEHRKRLNNRRMQGANNTTVSTGKSPTHSLDWVLENNAVADMLKDLTGTNKEDN